MIFSNLRRDACSNRSISALALDEVVLRRIQEIEKNQILLQRLLKEANSKTKEELEELEKERVILKLRISEAKARGKSLVDKLLQVGNEYSKFIKDKMKETEAELKELEERLREVESKIEQAKNYYINAEVVRDAELGPQEKKYL